MTSKERVKKAISHEPVDRVPLVYEARAEVTQKLRVKLGLKEVESVDDYLGADINGIRPLYKFSVDPLCYSDPTIKVSEDKIYFDIWGVGFKPNQTKNGFYMDLCYSPLKAAVIEKNLDKYEWPSVDDFDYSTIKDQIQKNINNWKIVPSRGVFEESWFIRGFNEFMMDLAMEPRKACEIMDHILDYLIKRTQKTLEQGAGLIDMVEYNDDVGCQGGLLVSPEMWREFLRPRMKKFIEMCKKYGAKIRYHSCGGIRPIIGDLIDIGVDILCPIQNSAKDMDIYELKNEFGKDLTFQGGIDTQYLLPHGSADEVREETKRLIDAFENKGGYIVAPSHVFQDDVPVDNILAVYEAALGCKF